MRVNLKSAILAALFLSVCVELTAPNAAIGSLWLSKGFCVSPRTYLDYYIEAASRLTVLDEATLYVIEICKEEKVDPLEILAILQIENPLHKYNALNINYTKVWNKKLKKYVKKELSRDEGLFQLNSACLDTFIRCYWVRYGETEEFNPMNYKHSTRVAVRLHKANKRQLEGSLYYAVMAYNTGIGNVLRGTPSRRTVEEYWPLFKSYYAKMKGV